MATLAIGAIGASSTGDLAGYSGTTHGQLLEFLRELGHDLVEPGDPSATHYLALDHNRHSLALVEEVVPVSNRILSVFEPRVVIPANYHRSTHKKYGSIISMTPALRVGDAPGFLPWAERDWRRQPAAPAERVAGTTALINANKISVITGSLYGLRRQVIEAFAREGQQLTLAGSNWLRSGRPVAVENAKALAYAVLNHERIDLGELAHSLRLSPTVDHLGIVDDKDDVLVRSEFCVVIENSASYISEKLFDAIIAGCVPLFTGPELSLFDIPEDVVIRMPHSARAFPAAVRTATADEKSRVLLAGREWLARDDTWEKWAMPNALRRFAVAVDAKLHSSDVR
jgi:hypothetical protein